MAERFPVLLVDDGELDDVRDGLLSIGVSFAHLRGGAVPSTVEAPRDLFIATARRAPLSRAWPRAERPVRIAVVGEDSEALRGTLRALGFSYLVRRPAHPVALRLLLLHALYRGNERRAAPRVPLGYPVAVKIGMRRRDALLADLSEEGCRILTDAPVAEGTKITIQVPSELCGSDDFILHGKVIRCTADRSSPGDGSQALAVQFSALTEGARALLAEALEAHRLGDPRAAEQPMMAPFVAPTGDGDEAAPRQVRRIAPPPLPAGPVFGKRPAKARSVPETPARSPSERRGNRRRRYAERVVAASASGDVHRVLIGRDLSPGGMRIDRQPEFSIGTSLRLALYDTARGKPVVVTAHVVRDDGARGMALCFDTLDADGAARLEHLVAGLPPVECLTDGESGAMGTVVSEILRN